MAELILRADGLEAGLKPHAGGALTHFADLSGPEPVDLLRRGVSGSDDPLDSAGFPLVPFCNRIRDGRFTFRGREVHLPPNMPGQKHPLHGQGWRGAWQVLEAGALPTGMISSSTVHTSVTPVSSTVSASQG